MSMVVTAAAGMAGVFDLRQQQRLTARVNCHANRRALLPHAAAGGAVQTASTYPPRPLTATPTTHTCQSRAAR